MKRVTPLDFQKLHPYFKDQPYWLCAYSLTCLLVWANEQYFPIVETTDDMAIFSVCYTECGKECEEMILPVAKGRIVLPEELSRIAKSLGRKDIEFVPQSYLNEVGIDAIEPYFTIEATPSLDDYIYLQSDLAELAGNKFSKKRNLINQFTREYIDTNRAQVEPLTLQNQQDALDYLEEWCSDHDCEDDDHLDLSAEKAAVANCITYIDVLDAKGLVIRIDEKIQAFGIVAPVTEDVIALHFEKASYHHKGLYQYLDMRCAADLCKGYTYINKESDMGIEGLAKAKKSYYPVQMIPSYTLIRKNK